MEMVGIEPTSEKVIRLNVYKFSQPISVTRISPANRVYFGLADGSRKSRLTSSIDVDEMHVSVLCRLLPPD